MEEDIKKYVSVNSKMMSPIRFMNIYHFSSQVLH